MYPLQNDGRSVKSHGKVATRSQRQLHSSLLQFFSSATIFNLHPGYPSAQLGEPVTARKMREKHSLSRGVVLSHPPYPLG